MRTFLFRGEVRLSDAAAVFEDIENYFFILKIFVSKKNRNPFSVTSLSL